MYEKLTRRSFDSEFKVSTVKNGVGDVVALVDVPDSTFVEIHPNESLLFKFLSQSNGVGNRKYILKSVGRYELGNSYVSELDSNRLFQKKSVNKTRLITKLYNNFPNPFNPNCIIKFQLSDPMYVTLVVYDVLGRRIKTLVDGWRLPGSYQVDFVANDLPSGIYIYQLQTENYTETKKMLLLK